MAQQFEFDPVFSPEDKRDISFQKEGGPYKVYSKDEFTEQGIELSCLGAYKDEKLVKYAEFASYDDYSYCGFMREIGLDLKNTAPEFLNENELHESYSGYDAWGTDLKVANQHPNSEYKLREFDEKNSQTLLVTFKNGKFISSVQFSVTDGATRDAYINEVQGLVNAETIAIKQQDLECKMQFAQTLKEKLQKLSDPQVKYKVTPDSGNLACDIAYTIIQRLPGQKAIEYNLFLSNKPDKDADLFVLKKRHEYMNVLDGPCEQMITAIAKGEGYRVLAAKEVNLQHEPIKADLPERSKIKKQIDIMLKKGFDRVGIIKYIAKRTNQSLAKITALVYKTSAALEKNDRGR